MRTNNYITQLILGRLEIASANKYSSKNFNLALGRGLGQGAKPAIFFAKTSPEWPLAQLLRLFPFETSWARPPQPTLLSGTPSPKFLPGWLSRCDLQWMFNFSCSLKSQSLSHTFKQQLMEKPQHLETQPVYYTELNTEDELWHTTK